MDTYWLIPDPVELTLTVWEDDPEKCLCCNEATSDIYLIGPLGRSILETLGRAPLATETLYQRIASEWGLSLTSELQHSIDHHLHTFKTIDLVATFQ